MSQNNDFIPFFLPSISQEEKDAVLRIMDSGWLTTGKETQSFEKEFANFINAKHALAVNSNTSGLILTYEACGIKEGTKILTTPYTFTATASAARHLNGHVVYADIEKDSYNISPEAIEKKLQEDKSIKVIVPVHIAGNLCDMKTICETAKKYDVKVVEDAAHAFPSKAKTGYAGTLGDAGVFSFYATKTMTTAEGGMITTNNDEIAHRVSLMRMHGIDRPVWDRYTSDKASWEYDIVAPGFKFNLPDILSALGRVQLARTPEFFEKRKKIAEQYTKAFQNVDFLQVPPDEDGNAWHLYILRIVPEKLKINRNEFTSILQKKGLGISMHFIPHFRMTYWKNLYNLKAEDFPNANRQFETSFSIPFWPDMSQEQVERVISTTIETGKEYYAST